MQELQEYRRQGLSIKEISALTGYDRKTVRKYLREARTPRYGPREPRPSKLDPYKEYLEQRLSAGVWNAVVLLRELRQRGYPGGYTVLREYLQPRRQSAFEVVVRRFETAPGHQAQVDWGDLGTLERGEERLRLSCFVMTLGYSRASFSDLSTDERLVTFLRLHEAAFEYLGGVPREILYDRPKTVLLGQDDRGEHLWHPVFRDFADYWGFVPRVCRAYRPQTKGKVESAIKYRRRNFLCGREAEGLEDLRYQLFDWDAQVANCREHGTTGRCVAEAWEEEKPSLQPLAGRGPYPYLPQAVRRVARDAYVAYGGNRYSVPWQAAGQEVYVSELSGRLEVYREGQRLAVHEFCSGRHQRITQAQHHQGIPGVPARAQGGKPRLRLKETEPRVEVRPLSVYEALAEGGSLG